MSELANRPLVWIADDSDTTARLTQSALGEQYIFERFADGAAVVERIAAGARLPDALLLANPAVPRADSLIGPAGRTLTTTEANEPEVRR